MDDEPLMGFAMAVAGLWVDNRSSLVLDASVVAEMLEWAEYVRLERKEFDDRIGNLRRALYTAACSSDPAEGLVLDHEAGVAWEEHELAENATPDRAAQVPATGKPGHAS